MSRRFFHNLPYSVFWIGFDNLCKQIGVFAFLRICVDLSGVQIVADLTLAQPLERHKDLVLCLYRFRLQIDIVDSFPRQQYHFRSRFCSICSPSLIGPRVVSSPSSLWGCDSQSVLSCVVHILLEVRVDALEIWRSRTLAAPVLVHFSRTNPASPKDALNFTKALRRTEVSGALYF